METETNAPASQQPVPLCLDCAYHSRLPDGQWIKNESSHRCAQQLLRNPVDGQDACCFGARSLRGGCGPEGRLFREGVVEGPATYALARREVLLAQAACAVERAAG